MHTSNDNVGHEQSPNNIHESSGSNQPDEGHVPNGKKCTRRKLVIQKKHIKEILCMLKATCKCTPVIIVPIILLRKNLKADTLELNIHIRERNQEPKQNLEKLNQDP